MLKASESRPARHHVKHGLPHCAVLIRWVDQVTTLHVLALDIYVARLPVVDSDRCREQSAVDWLPLRSRSHLIVRRNQSNVTTPSPRQIKTSSMSLGGHLPTIPRVLDCAAIRFPYLPASCRCIFSTAVSSSLSQTPSPSPSCILNSYTRPKPAGIRAGSGGCAASQPACCFAPGRCTHSVKFAAGGAAAVDVRVDTWADERMVAVRAAARAARAARAVRAWVLGNTVWMSSSDSENKCLSTVPTSIFSTRVFFIELATT